MVRTDFPPSVSGARSRLSAAFAARFGIDARALAALRISLGLLLVADLSLRARHLDAFYTDFGVLPRSVLYEQYPTVSQFSIHTLSGDAWVQALLFALAGAFAVSLVVGYRTRTASLLSLVCFVSLSARNPGVLNGGDSLLFRLLFWGLFLPLGERWSLDARRRTGAPRDRIASLASAALLLQIVLVYSVNAVFKLRGDLWVGGEAVRYVLSLQQFTVRFGDSLAQFPVLLRVVDAVWLGLVVAAPFLILLRGRARAAFVSLFVGMHAGMFLTMRLGLFPLVSITALSVFLPSSSWDWLAARLSNPAERAARRVGPSDRFDRIRPRASSPSLTPRVVASLANSIRRTAARIAPAVVAASLAAMLVWNAAAVGAVAMPGENPQIDPTEQTWDMFAPYPLTTDGWYAAPGTLESGDRVDAFYLSSPVGDDRPDTSEMYPSARWRKYLVGVRYSGSERLERGVAGYFCRRWNATHEDDLTNVTVYYVEQPTRLDGPEPTRRVELTDRNCSTGV